MKLGISPTVDIVFKKLFGSPDHPRLTKSLLNAVLAKVGRPLVDSVEILNPYVAAAFLGDRDAILDIKARDQSGRVIQIEMQVAVHAGLPQRMVHNWAQVYSGQLLKGHTWRDLLPVVSIWFVVEPFTPNTEWVEAWSLSSEVSAGLLVDELLIVTLDLSRWRKALKDGAALGTFESELDRWSVFFWTAEEWDLGALPPGVPGTELEEAIDIMAAFTQEELERDLYQRRLEYQTEMAQFRWEHEEGLRKAIEQGSKDSSKDSSKASGRSVGKPPASSPNLA